MLEIRLAGEEREYAATILAGHSPPKKAIGEARQNRQSLTSLRGRKCQPNAARNSFTEKHFRVFKPFQFVGRYPNCQTCSATSMAGKRQDYRVQFEPGRLDGPGLWTQRTEVTADERCPPIHPLRPPNALSPATKRTRDSRTAVAGVRWGCIRPRFHGKETLRDEMENVRSAGRQHRYV